MADWDPEVDVDEALARTLIAECFPALDSSSLRRIGTGWENVVWATADGIAFRFPRRQVAMLGVEREIAILPALAPCLPLAVPDATYPGSPSALFPWPWFGSRLIAGREIASAYLSDAQRTALAPRLGLFLRTLHSLRLSCAVALPLDPMDRADMAIRVPKTREALAKVASLWTLLVHGDLHVRHLLVDDACELAGVIDWGDVCLAHPSADLSLYWSLLPPSGRAAFLESYGPVEGHGLVRARVLALFLCATLASYAHAEAIPDLEREAIGGLHRTLLSHD
jgi:aminoglycoside phosphotransferase (APT) family kinase protein